MRAISFPDATTRHAELAQYLITLDGLVRVRCDRILRKFRLAGDLRIILE